MARVEAIRPLARRIRLMAGRAVVHLVNDALKVQGMQIGVLADETANVQRFQEYGFTSNPLAGAEAVMLCMAGVRSHGIVIATEDGRYRLKNLAPGEVALYTDEGDTIIFKRGKEIDITSGGKVKVNAQDEVDVAAPNVKITAPTKITADTPELHCTGKITAADIIESEVDVQSNGVSLVNHPTTGVTSGDEVSGPPEPTV